MRYFGGDLVPSSIQATALESAELALSKLPKDYLVEKVMLDVKLISFTLISGTGSTLVL